MTTLKIASWNLRTFGAPLPMDVTLRDIATIIIDVLAADIVCLQEIQAGSDVTTQIGCPVSPPIVSALNDLLTKLRNAEPAADWQFALSGVNNSERAATMRDAYAFFWKVTPNASSKSHADAPTLIALLQGPEILRQPFNDQFPGRRPGMVTFEITGAPSAPPVPVNVISWHAATPCNTVGKAKNGASSGRALLQLATLTEIGGVLRKGTKGGWSYEWAQGAALPQVDTIFLGDCNYSMTASQAQDVYYNLSTNYQPCVSTFEKIVDTTYSADPTRPFTSSSSYDNIFLLRKHKQFYPALSFTGKSGAFDFIAYQAEKLGNVSGITYFANEAAWYVCYVDNYKRQNAFVGISDHLPVWADFTVGDSLTASRNICPTSGADNNCLFHAVFGTQGYFDIYVDAAASTHRTNLANSIQNAINPTNFGTIRQHVLAVMINEFQGSPAYLSIAQNLLTNPFLDPFQAPEWAQMATHYIQGIRSGRMLYADEAAMLALFAGITINLWYVDAGTYKSMTFNAGKPSTIDIYHFGLHFFRFLPN